MMCYRTVCDGQVPVAQQQQRPIMPLDRRRFAVAPMMESENFWRKAFSL